MEVCVKIYLVVATPADAIGITTVKIAKVQTTAEQNHVRTEVHASTNPLNTTHLSPVNVTTCLWDLCVNMRTFVAGTHVSMADYVP